MKPITLRTILIVLGAAVLPLTILLFVVTWWVAGGRQHALAEETSYGGVLVLHLVCDLLWALVFVGVVWVISRQDEADQNVEQESGGNASG